MIDIKFQINGNNVNANNLQKELESASLSAITTNVKRSMGRLKCAEHGQSPKIKVKGQKLRNLSFEVSGCCPDLIEKARAAISLIH